jgi:DAK2 domain fusion protein YloV
VERVERVRYARTTLPALRHEVQTPSFFGVLPDGPVSAWTVWMFGFQRRRVRRWEWLTDMPKPGPLPHTSQVAATVTPDPEGNISGAVRALHIGGTRRAERTGPAGLAPDDVGHSSRADSLRLGARPAPPPTRLEVRVLQVLDASAVRRWCAAGREALAAAREEIDDLNVYPVPDGDTGTNLLLTMEAVESALAEASGDMAATVRAMAHGALMGARGNSGVILSQLLRGLAEVLEAAETCSASEVRRALTRASELCYASVATPVEGTLLTVARECAEAVMALGEDVDLATVVCEARTAAARSLARTPDLLPQLRAAGVVDAGGRGLCVLLEALEQVVTGECRTDAVPAPLVPRDRSALTAVREAGSEDFSYEVQLLLRDAADEAVEQLTRRLGALGDSLVVVGGGTASPGLYNVHVHVNDVGAAVEAAVDAGRPFRISVTRFADQVAGQVGGQVGGHGADPTVVPPEAPAGRSGRSVVAVAPGAGLAELFRSSGALVVEGRPGARPSTADLLGALRRSGAAEVVLLPNDPDTAAVARAAADQAREDGCSVVVVPTRSVLQGLSAVAVADGSRLFADDVASMADAAGSTRTGEVTVAVREAATMAGICHPGDVLGLLDGDVALIGDDPEQVAGELLHRLLTGGGELVTVVTGERAPAGSAGRLAESVEKAHPAVEVVCYDGGQPLYPFLLGVE